MSVIHTLKLHVIFQTHWDHEWYFPYESFSLWNPEEKEQPFTVLCNGLSRASSLK